MNADELMAELIEKTKAAFEPYVRRNIENLHRIGRLVRQAKETQNNDILRAAVVFLHATLEDFLRSAAADFLPTANETVLNRIPLAGSNGSRADKFPLGRLCSFRKMTVEELIKTSIDVYLQRATFNNAEDIIHLLASLEFDQSQVQVYLASLEQMMQRRHQIVHRADRVSPDVLAEIDDSMVMEWANIVIQFMGTLAAQVHAKHTIVGIKSMLRDVAKSRNIDLSDDL